MAEAFCRCNGKRNLWSVAARNSGRLSSFSAQWAGALYATAVPSLIELEGIYNNAGKGKAAGTDAIRPEILAAAPQAMARVFHPIVVKSALCFEEPLAWKGGVRMELFKGKSSILECKSYRDILVSDISGKLYHKALRSRASPILDAMARDTRCGGTSSRGTDFGAHIVRQFLDLGRVRKKSVAILFVDVVGAFASVVRGIVIGGLADASQVAAVCARLRLSTLWANKLWNLSVGTESSLTAVCPRTLRRC